MSKERKSPQLEKMNDEGISIKDIPESKVFDVKVYSARDWVLVFMDKTIFDKIMIGCEKRGLDVKKVLYGAIVELQEKLNGEGRNEVKD